MWFCASKGQKQLNRGPRSHPLWDRRSAQGAGAVGSPHSLFLQEVHLQALHVQEPAQLQEPPASKGETAVSRSGTQGPQQMSAMPPSPSCSVRAQPWELLPHSGTCRSPSFSLLVLDGRSPPDFLHRQVPGSRPDWG